VSAAATSRNGDVGDGGGQDAGSGGLSGGAISGIVIAIVIALAGAAVFGWWIWGRAPNLDGAEYPNAEMDQVTVDEFDAWATAGPDRDAETWTIEPAGATDVFIPRSVDEDVEFAPKFE
jgi:hypothetical protein